MFYKVVRVKNGKFYSRASYSDVLQELNLVKEYSTTFWTHRLDHENKLMVFDSLINARKHICDKTGQFQIYECEVINPSNKGLFMNIDTIHKIEYVKYLKAEKSTSLPPEGTVYCDSVKLFRLVS